MPGQLQAILDNLKSLGARRLAMLAGAGALVLAIVIGASVYLNRPASEVLYVGLDRSDVTQISMVLAEAGIATEVGTDGSSVMVPVGRTGTARAILAERGLPASSNAGYELFDQVGSFGLTSFMQQITRVRALEGEIARTIQSMAGVRAARVHIVLADRGSFRAAEQQPTASVVIRMVGGEPSRTATSIRHLVAAAVPGLNPDKVTVLDSAGALLAAGDDPANNAITRSIGVERTIEAQIEENIRRALSPYLGLDNFRASVRAEVNTDARQIEETRFDPDSRVERSVQVVRSMDQANQRQPAPPTTVQQNLPEEQPGAGDGPESSEQRERREETTNYELNTTRIATISNGYTVNKLSIAVVVNRERLAGLVDPQGSPEQLRERIDEIRAMVTSAAGYSDARGDVVNVTAVEFVDELENLEPAGGGVAEIAGRNLGTIINALAFILVAFLVVWFGVRPLAKAVSGQEKPTQPSFDEVQRSLPNPGQIALPGSADIGGGMAATDDLKHKIRPAPQERLTRMVDLNEERTATILRKWAHKEAA